MRAFVASLVTTLVLAGTATGEPLKGDGPGCKDRALGAELASIQETDPRYIEIWATGMQDQSCRGFSAGQDVTEDERAEGIACIRTAEDDACFWVRADMAPR